MGDTAAERQRRSRAHRRGDHTLCDPARCDAHVDTAAPVTTEAPRATISAAERQRRSRAHRRDDHSLCDSTRCDAAVTQVNTQVTAPVTSTPEVDLAVRGRRLWDQVTGAGRLTPGEQVLLEEACRIADRLDRLDRQLDGRESWLQLTEALDGRDVTVVVDKALSESRQQQSVLARLLVELRQSRTDKTMPSQQGPDSGDGSMAGVADLAAFAAARSPRATG